jgi:hypothetical protein
MNYLFLYEDFKSGKFRFEDIEKARKSKKSIFTSIVKDKPDHNKDIPLQIINIDEDEVGVLINGDVYYVDLKDIEKIG